MIRIVPAILTNDINDFNEKMKSLRGISEWIQVDIMDGDFVPNVSINIDAAAIYSNDLSIEAHLMVRHPMDYIEKCKQSGVKRVLFHVESADSIPETVNKIHEAGMEAGIAVNPETDIESISDTLSLVDSILLLGVHPGLQGQSFIPETLRRIRETKTLFPNKLVFVDGGVNKDTLLNIISSGADGVVVGSAIVQTNDKQSAMAELRRVASK